MFPGLASHFMLYCSYSLHGIDVIIMKLECHAESVNSFDNFCEFFTLNLKLQFVMMKNTVTLSRTSTMNTWGLKKGLNCLLLVKNKNSLKCAALSLLRAHSTERVNDCIFLLCKLSMRNRVYKSLNNI